MLFLLGAAVTGVLGYRAVEADRVNWKALAAISHAQDVLRQQPRINLALIGFVEPPLPALLHIPLAWVAPSLARSGHGAWVFGALLAGLTLSTLNALGADLGLGRPVRWPLCALALASPVYLGLAATGSPDALYILLMLGGVWALLRWQRDEALRDLITSSLLFSLVLLTRYDAVVPVGAATLVIACQTLARGGRWAKLEGILIAFLLPIVYFGGLWVLANWVILGHPWHFWRLAWGGEPTIAPIPGSQAVLGAVAAFAALPAVVWWALWGGAAGRPRLAIGAALVLVSPALAALIVPRLFGIWYIHAAQSDLPLTPIPELFAPVLVAGWFLTACALGDVAPLFARRSYTKEVCLAGSAALLAFGGLLVMGPEERAFLDPRPALVGRPFGADDATGARVAAGKLRRSAPRGLLAVAGWPGYAVTLYADRVSDKVLLVSLDPPKRPVKGAPAAALLIREGGKGAGSRLRGWERALGTPLDHSPAWTADGWSYYQAKPPPPRKEPAR